MHTITIITVITSAIKLSNSGVCARGIHTTMCLFVAHMFSS